MTSRKSYKDKRGAMLVDMLVAISLAAIFIVVITESSLGARDLFDRAHDRQSFIEAFKANGASSAEATPYGNDRIETDMRIGPLAFVGVRAYPYAGLSQAAGTPLCSPDFLHGNESAQISIMRVDLPISRPLPLTDLQVRDGIAYVSADSSVASDPDLLVFDIHDPNDPRLLSSINTGPGISAIALVGKRIYAAADSTAAQLHVIRLDSLSSPTLEAKLRLPLPYATATAPVADSIFYDDGKVYLGTDKWDGDELNVIDVSDPAQPNELGGFETGAKANALFVRGGVAYVASPDQSQLRLVDVSDPSNLQLLDAFWPSGWQRQEGQAIGLFEGALSFGRTSGGFDIPTDHEAFAWSTTSSATLLDPLSADVPGGVYGIVADRMHLFIGTRQAGKEFQVFDRALSASMAYPLPASVEMMTCDNDSIYALGRASPVIYKIAFN